jgi:hypothetical protein
MVMVRLGPPGKIARCALLLAAGCTTSTPDPQAPAPQGSAGSATGPVPEATCPTQPVPRTPLRRLTRWEYQNATRDLLHVDTSAARDLPADEITNSFDNNAGVLTVSALHAEKYVLVSETLAKEAVKDLSSLTACNAPAQGDEACARAFAKAFGRRAFRRPTTPEDEQGLMTAYQAGRQGGSHAEGIEVMVRAALQSPSFLYRLETTSPADARPQIPLSQFELATRLSFMLWGSGPDDALLDAAARSELGTKAQIAVKAREMLAAPQARTALANFFKQWTGAQRLEITTKSSNAFPSFTAELKAAMAAELPALVDDVLWSGDHRLKSLLTAPIGFVDSGLAAVYGVTAPTAGAGSRVELPAEQGRAGLLTQAGFLSVQGHPDQTSPVLRGKFVRAMLLCQPPPPPPPDVDISLPPASAGATARERMAAHLSAGNSCSSCHSLMDPIGLAFESFDAMGRHRVSEGGQPIDLSGEVTGASDAALAGPFKGVQELALKLAESEQVRACLATQWFRFASGRSEAQADQCSLAAMRESFDSSSGDVLELIVASTQTDAFLFRSPTP